MYGFARCHVRVFLVCRLASFCGASLDTCVSDNCFVVVGFGGWEVFLVDVFVPCLVYGSGAYCCRFEELSMLLGCWLY